MMKTLDSTEVRVLASLVEKQVTTPEYYPLTLNALVQACNQKNNREPVVSFDEAIVERALETLRAKNLVYVFYGSSSRVPKYKHMMSEVYEMEPQELAVVVVLMLRGAQTIGELRERASRLHDFSSLGEVEQTLNSLMTREAQPLVTKLPRQPNQKDVRYAHLLAGEPSTEQFGRDAALEIVKEPSSTQAEKLARLEGQVETLTAELNSLRREFEDFKKQFS